MIPNYCPTCDGDPELHATRNDEYRIQTIKCENCGAQIKIKISVDLFKSYPILLKQAIVVWNEYALSMLIADFKDKNTKES